MAFLRGFKSKIWDRNLYLDELPVDLAQKATRLHKEDDKNFYGIADEKDFVIEKAGLDEETILKVRAIMLTN
jgi:hypothetical protein